MKHGRKYGSASSWPREPNGEPIYLRYPASGEIVPVQAWHAAARKARTTPGQLTDFEIEIIASFAGPEDAAQARAARTAALAPPPPSPPPASAAAAADTAPGDVLTADAAEAQLAEHLARIPSACRTIDAAYEPRAAERAYWRYRLAPWTLSAADLTQLRIIGADIAEHAEQGRAAGRLAKSRGIQGESEIQSLTNVLRLHFDSEHDYAMRIRTRLDWLEGRLATLEHQLAEERAKPALRYRGVWQANHLYEADDAVTHDGSLWITRTATSTTPGAGPTPWQLAVKRGRDGKDRQ